MPMFWLSVRSPTNVFPDTEGSDLADVAAAVEEARTTAREMWADGIRIGLDRRNWVIEIADEAGCLLRSLPFKEAVRSPEDIPGPG